MEQQETRRRRIAFATSAGIHLILLLLFLFSMAWRAPDPPLPEFGIELNFGDSQVGSGDEQPETATATPVEQEPEEEQLVEEEQAQPEQTQQEVVPSAQESVVTEPEEEKPATTDSPKPDVKKEEEKKEEVKPAAPTTPTTGNQPKSEGDDKDKTGDKGDPKGVPDPNAAYTGKPGGGADGNGMALSMSGWAWADNPKIPELPDNADGRIVFDIECDEDGEITRIQTRERGLSLQAEKLLIEEIRRNSLVRTGDGKIPPMSKGQIIFVLKTK